LAKGIRGPLSENGWRKKQHAARECRGHSRSHDPRGRRVFFTFREKSKLVHLSSLKTSRIVLHELGLDRRLQAWLLGELQQTNLGVDDLLFSRHGVLQCAEAGRFATPTAPRPASARDSP